MRNLNVYIHKIRYRFWNGESIETNIKCIENPNLLKAAFELKLTQLEIFKFPTKYKILIIRCY
jgi:hypothetical protein